MDPEHPSRTKESIEMTHTAAPTPAPATTGYQPDAGLPRSADIGLIGLAVMGQNLVLNMNDHGFTVAVFNRTTSVVDDFLQDAAAGRETIIGTYSLEELVSTLSRPRKVMLMVKAGEVVDIFIERLLPLLEPGDIIIDGGNSLYADTDRRVKSLRDRGLLFVGSGISGGEEGARRGPSIMPGGNPEAWPHVRPLLQAIAAVAHDGEPCCDWMGEGGAGHYVKMVHNGIEYGDMQLIAETYHLLKEGLGLSYTAMRDVFRSWDTGDLESYLIEITGRILEVDDVDGTPLVERILDTAGQKGTGKWTGISSMELGVPVTLIGESVFARCLSAMKEERVTASTLLTGPSPAELPSLMDDEQATLIDDLGKALLASKIVSYSQGFMLMREAAREKGWKLDYGSIARVWREGCIIRSVFLDRISDAYRVDPELPSILFSDYFRKILADAQSSWRRVVAWAITRGIPMPAATSALSFYDGYRSAWLPANMLQAQRDFFGAHTYERTDRPRGEKFHTDWTGTGGHVASGNYTV